MRVEHINKESKSGYPHDKIYDVISLDVRMKTTSTGEWVNAVAYGCNGQIFVREENDFYEKFKIVEK